MERCETCGCLCKEEDLEAVPWVANKVCPNCRDTFQEDNEDET